MTERFSGYEGKFRVARREYAPRYPFKSASTSEVILGGSNEATLANPVLPQSDTGFFRAFSKLKGLSSKV